MGLACSISRSQQCRASRRGTPADASRLEPEGFEPAVMVSHRATQRPGGWSLVAGESVGGAFRSRLQSIGSSTGLLDVIPSVPHRTSRFEKRQNTRLDPQSIDRAFSRSVRASWQAPSCPSGDRR